MGFGLAHEGEPYAYVVSSASCTSTHGLTPPLGAPKPAYTLRASSRRYRFIFLMHPFIGWTRLCTGNLDNAYWGGDLNIPTNRPSYQINDTR